MGDPRAILRSALARGLGLAADRIHASQLDRGWSAFVDSGLETAALGAFDRLLECSPDDPIWLNVASYFTVNESWIFRRRSWFSAVVGVGLGPILAARRHANRRELVLWSVGCAQGEEAYSLALLAQAMVGGDEDWNIRVVGMDASATNIQAARAGDFESRDLRELTEAEVQRWFSPVSGGLFQIESRTRNCVRFEPINLAGSLDLLDTLPPPDFVMCRNVLMYLSADVQERVLEKLASRMAHGAAIAVAPAEASIFTDAYFDRETTPGPQVHRRNCGQSVRLVEPPVAIRSGTPLLGSEPNNDMSDAGPQRAGEHLVHRDSARLTGQALDAQHWRLQAALAEERGELEAAAELRRRVVYLEPGVAQERYLLGCVLSKLGRHRAAETCFRTALVLLDDDSAQEAGEPSATESLRLRSATLRRLASQQEAYL